MKVTELGIGVVGNAVLMYDVLIKVVNKKLVASSFYGILSSDNTSTIL